MKYLIIATLGMAAVFGADPKIVSLADITKESIEGFMEGKNQDMILACPAGTVLPLKISLKGEFLGFESTDRVQILKSCFVKHCQESFLFSLDGKTWKNFSEFFKGNLCISIDRENCELVVGVECDLNQRH